jgi:hypothetical protein
LYRFNGELRRETLGRYGHQPPALTLSQARQKARYTLSLVEDSKDPRAIAAAAKAAEAERRRSLQANNVTAVIELYIKRVASQRRWPDLECTLRNDIAAAWGDRPIKEIGKHDVLEAADAEAFRRRWIQRR